MRARALTFATLLALALAACGGSTEVGGSLAGELGKGGRLEGFGKSPTPTVAAKATQSKSSGSTTKKNDANKAPSVEFKITAAGFDPYYIQVFSGGIVKVTNRDTVARSVTAAPNQAVQFDSGLIRPGASWTYTATTPGQFNFGDSTRPYVVGTLKVLPR